MTNLQFTNSSPSFGAELDPSVRLLDLKDVTEFEQLCAERGVVVARNQVMSLDEQVEFSARLGELFKNPANKGVPEELIKIRATARSEKVPGTGWHSDVSSEEKPPGLSILRMEIVPESGGDTLFADMRQVFSALSPAMQAFLKTLTAQHDPKSHFLYLRGVKTMEELGAAIHPMVRLHPLTNDPALYVNSGFTGRIMELSDTESESLLKFLYDKIAYSVDAQIRVRWEPDTIVFWDNRIVQHHASFDYWPQERKGYRSTVRGEAVIPAT